MSYCYLAFRTNVLLNLCCPGHLSYYSPNESEPLETLLYVFDSCERQSEPSVEMCIPLRPIPEGDTLWSSV